MSDNEVESLLLRLLKEVEDNKSREFKEVIELRKEVQQMQLTLGRLESLLIDLPETKNKIISLSNEVISLQERMKIVWGALGLIGSTCLGLLLYALLKGVTL